MRCSVVMLAAVWGLAIVQPSPAAAQAGSGTEIDQLRSELKDALVRIDQLEQRLQVFERDAATGEISDTNAAEVRGRGVATSQPAAAPPSEADISSGSATAGAEGDRKSPAPSDAVETVARSEQNFVGDRFGIEPGFNYSRFSNAQLNLSGFLALDSIFLGLISIDEINSDIFTTDLTVRFGPTPRLTFDVNVPYVFRRTNFQSGGAGGSASGLVEQDVTQNGISDVSAGLSYRILPETFRRPDVVVSARLRVPTGKHPYGVELVEVPGTEGNLSVPQRLATGAGVYGASFGVSVLKTIDPMVVYGSVTYFRNFKRGFDDIGEVVGNQPGDVSIGDSIQFGAGVAFALNEKSSLSTSFTQRIIQRSRLRFAGQPWQTVVGSHANSAVLNIGATFSLTDRLAIISNLGAGLTDDAPDFQFGVRLPYRF